MSDNRRCAVLRDGMGHLPRPDDWDHIAGHVLDLVGRDG
jgi:hypothetical protein